MLTVGCDTLSYHANRRKKLMPDENTTSLLYFADPMCSWCWGFSPIIRHLSKQFRDTLPIQMIMGGLQAGQNDPISAQQRDELHHHWLQVAEASGQAFNFDFFQRESFIYNTEPACRAVITCQRLLPDNTLLFLTQLQTAFYVNNRDITDSTVLSLLATESGLPEDGFAQMFDDTETHRITALHFQYTRYCHVNGFPTLIGQRNQVNTVITRGYQPLEKIQSNIEHWLSA